VSSKNLYTIFHKPDVDEYLYGRYNFIDGVSLDAWEAKMKAMIIRREMWKKVYQGRTPPKSSFVWREVCV
jgi:hypothetical protein